jgi:hypothetical protein
MTAGSLAPPRPLPPWAAGLLLAGVLAVFVLALSRADPAGGLFFVAYAGIGAYLATRRPGNPVGWLLMLTGLGLAVGSVRWRWPVETLVSGNLDLVQTLEAWSNAIGWSLAFVGVFGISLVFPSGRLPGGRGRLLARLGLAVMGILLALIAFGPTLAVTIADTNLSVDAPNPFALLPDAGFWSLVPEPGTLYLAMFAVVLAGIAGLVARYRRATGLERMQYRWLVAAIALVALATAAWAFLAFAIRLEARLGDLLTLLTYPLVPVAIAVAVQRYRLYELDRMISRSISYAIVSAILVGVFGLGIVVLSTALSSFAEGQTLAIAGSTLIAYAAVQPVLQRVRRNVDRRFDRARYDHERTVTDFSARLRDEINVDALTSELAETTRAAVAPTSVSLWLRSGPLER